MATMTVLHDNVVDDDDAPVLLAPGVELLGEYTDAGFSRPQYLLRRPDGQVVLVSQLLYLVAAALRHHDRLGAVARVVGDQLDLPLTAADVDHLIGTQLRPAGVLAAYGDQLVVVPPTHPSRRLSLRVGAVPPRLQWALTRVLGPLFHLAVAANLLTVMLLVDAWLVSHPDALLDAWAHVATRLPLVLVVAGLMIAGLAFREVGRAAACRFGGGRPGPIDVGVRIVWPAVHADVTDAYRLDRRNRVRTHAGGVYSDVVFTLALAAGYAATGAQPLLAALVLPQVHALYQLLPFARLDGYHILSDLVGVPNLFAYLPAATTTLLPLQGAPRRRASHTLNALTHPAKTALRAWIALTVAVAALGVAVVAYLAARTAPQLGRTIRTTAEQLATTSGDGNWTSAATPALQLALLGILVFGWAALLRPRRRTRARRRRTPTRPHPTAGPAGPPRRRRRRPPPGRRRRDRRRPPQPIRSRPERAARRRHHHAPHPGAPARNAHHGRDGADHAPHHRLRPCAPARNGHHDRDGTARSGPVRTRGERARCTPRRQPHPGPRPPARPAGQRRPDVDRASRRQPVDHRPRDAKPNHRTDANRTGNNRLLEPPPRRQPRHPRRLRPALHRPDPHPPPTS